MKKRNAIFIAATGQHVGKTTTCLGLIAGMHKRFKEVGFIKPVGQHHVTMGEGIRVDKDAVLFKQHFNLKDDWKDISPVIIPSGYTRDFLDKKISEEGMIQSIKHSFEKVYNNNAYTIVEGTGHVGVGSIVEVNNAKVAATLGLDMIIIASGGLGSSFDELLVNIAMCEKYGVKVRGVILNRVFNNKRDMILKYFPKSLERLGIPLIGCIPYNDFLNNPTVRDFETLFDTPLLSGEKHHYRHFVDTRLVACSLDAFKDDMTPNELLITPADREDIISAILAKHKNYLVEHKKDFGCGIIMTGRVPPSKQILEEIRKVDIPTLYAPTYSYDAMKMITSYTAKIRCKDTPKIEKAISLVEEYIDFNQII